jgi:hypothetical protein
MQPLAPVREHNERSFRRLGERFHIDVTCSRQLVPSDDPANSWLTIVGVVADVETTTVFQEMGYVEQPALYRPLTQSSPSSLTLMIAVSGSPTSPGRRRAAAALRSRCQSCLE